MDCSPPDTSVDGDSPGKNTRVGCHFLLQGIFPTQGLNLGFLHCRQILYHLSYRGSPKLGTSRGHQHSSLELFTMHDAVLYYLISDNLYGNNMQVRRHRLPDLSIHVCGKVCAFMWKRNLNVNHSLCTMEFWDYKHECNSTISIQHTSKRMFASLFTITVIKQFLWV